MAIDRKALAAGYCVLPDTAVGDPVFGLCYDAAIEYAANAGVPEPDGASALYDMLICMLASTWYDNRGSVVVGQLPHNLERSAAALILSLR